MTSKDYLKQIAESKGVCPLTNEVKDNALLFPIGFEKIFQDLDRLENLEKTFGILIAVLDRVLIFKFKEDTISGGKIYISKIDTNNITIANLRKSEYDLLKEVLENGL